MSVAILRFSALCCVVTLVAGCGGSSIGGGSAAGGGSTPTVVTFNFTIATPTVVAARVGAGLFTTQTLNSRSLSLSIPNGTTNFSVAYACTLPLSAQVQVPEQFVFEASTADGSSFTAPCPMAVPSSQTGAFTGSVDASGIPGATLVDIAASNGTSTTVGGVTLNAAFSLAEPAGVDRVMVLAYNNSQQGLSSLVAAKNFTNETVPGALNGAARLCWAQPTRRLPKQLHTATLHRDTPSQRRLSASSWAVRAALRLLPQQPRSIRRYLLPQCRAEITTRLSRQPEAYRRKGKRL